MADFNFTADRFTRDNVELLGTEEAWQGFYRIERLTLRHSLFKGGWSQPIRRELFMRHNAVGVLLYDPVLDAVALIEQFRVGAYDSDVAREKGRSPWLLELVAGLIDKAEQPEEVVIREAEEEAGAMVQALECIGEYYSSPGGSNEYFYLFVGKADLSEAGGVHGLEEEGEDIRVHRFPVTELWTLLEEGQLINAHTLIAVQWLKLHHQQLREKWL